MEMSWLSAWSGFSAIAILGRSFPLFAAAAVFLLGSLLAWQTAGRGWRRVSILGMHITVFLFAAGGLMYLLYHGHEPASARPGIVRFLTMGRDVVGWIIVFSNIFWAFLFYRGGVCLAKREKDYYTLCSRFDLGLAAFFMLFLTKFLLDAKAGIIVDSSAPVLFVFPFFLFGLLTIGLIRCDGNGVTTFLPGYAGGGTILAFSAGVILLGGGCVLFLLPLLSQVTDASFNAAKTVASPLASLFLSVIRFLHMPRTARPDPPGAGLSSRWDRLATGSQDGWQELAGRVLAWGLSGLLLLLLLLVLAIALMYLVKWLLSRTSPAPRPYTLKPGGSWLLRVKLILLALYRRAITAIRGNQTASELFRALSRWADHSGLPRIPCETPLEFATRLMDRFPAMKTEIDCITDLFNEETYAERAPSNANLRRGHRAWHRLRSPVLWPSRLKARLLPGNTVNGNDTSGRPGKQ